MKAVEVVEEVNLWAEEQTNGFIKQVLPADEVNSLTSSDKCNLFQRSVELEV